MNPEEEAKGLVDPDLLPEAQDLDGDEEDVVVERAEVPGAGSENERLDDLAQGHSVTDDPSVDGTSEIDAMAVAAGLAPDNDRAYRGVTAIEDRDTQRWELDPRSADDAAERDLDGKSRR